APGDFRLEGGLISSFPASGIHPIFFAASMNPDKLKQLEIVPEQKRRPRVAMWLIALAVLVVTGGSLYFAWPKAKNKERIEDPGVKMATKEAAGPSSSASIASATTPPPPAAAGDSVLTVSGYIVNRERIELSPRFLGVVTWIGVKKGDAVTNGQ